MRPASCFLVLLCGTGWATLLYAQSTDTSIVKLPQDIEFKGPLTGGAKTAFSDPSKPGVFVTREVLGGLERPTPLAS